jgi:hypothetical protein
MLDDQEFAVPTTLALGLDFFLDADRQPDYGIALAFAHRLDAARERYAFHCWDIDRPENRYLLGVLHAWGVPLQEALWLPEHPTAKVKRQLDLALLSVEFMWARHLGKTYRITGQKNISTIEPESVLNALVYSLSDLAPHSLRRYLSLVQLA